MRTASSLIPALALIVGATAPAYAAQPDATTLGRWCSQYQRTVDGAVLEPNEAIEAASCLAYVRGVVDAQYSYTQHGGRRPWCLPDGGVRLDEVTALVAGEPVNPGVSMIEFLDAALTGAYPCQR